MYFAGFTFKFLLAQLSVLLVCCCFDSRYNNVVLSFSALDFSHNIIRLENTIANVSNCVSSNLLSLSLSLLVLLKLNLPLWST